MVRNSDNKRRSSNSGQKEKTSQAPRGKITSIRNNSNKIPFSSCSNRGIRNNNHVEDMDMFDGEEDLFDDNGDENFDFDQLDQIEQEVKIEQDVIDNAFDDNFDFDQIDQIEKEVVQKNLNCNSKPDQRVNSSLTENEFFDEDFIYDDFDLDDFDMEQSRIAFPKMDSGRKKSREAFKTENIEKQSVSLPMAKKLKTAMRSPETNKITSRARVSTEKRADTTEHRGSSFVNYGGVGPCKSGKTTAQSSKATGKLGLKKLNINSLQSTIKFDAQKSLSGFKKDEGSDEAVEPVGSKNKTCTSFIKVKTEGRWDDTLAVVGNSALDKSATHGGTSSMKYNEMRSEMGNTQGNKTIKKFGLKKSSQTPHQSTIQFNIQQPSLDTFVKKERSIEVVDLIEEDDADVPVVETSEEPETLLPFTYLSQVLKDQPYFEERTFRIKVSDESHFI